MCGKFEKGEALLTEAEPSFERRGLDGWGLSTGGFEAQLNAANDRDQGRPPPQQQEPQQQQDHRLDLLSSRSSERSPQQQPQQSQPVQTRPLQPTLTQHSATVVPTSANVVQPQSIMIS